MDIQYKYIHVRDKALKADHTIINYMYMYLHGHIMTQASIN